MKHPKFSRSFEVVSELPVPLRPLRVLAMNLRWSWDHDTRDLFRSVDKELWEEVEHNPVELIERLNPERLERLVKDTGFLNRLASCEKALADYMAAPTWFDANYPKRRDSVTIAYFCAEFGLSEALPIYSGGLGVLAGDHLKAASDLGLPLVGVGLLYSRGYFRQRLNHDGWQEEVYPQIDFFGLPLQLVRGADEAPSRISIEMPDRTVTCQIWKAQIGRIPLYLLDSNVLENAPKDQEITDTLYGGDEEMRIRQEMILGIGGMRALSALGIKPTVCHMNEGHSAFLALERIRQFMAETGSDLSTARQVIVSGDVFTTHTPVPAGFDRFTPDLLERYVGPTAKASGFASDQLLKLGRIERDNQGEPFNMAIFAMANSNYVNGVSQLHASVTREMFQARWPGYPEDEVPIVAITNGVHTHTWISHDMAELFDEYLGQDWRRNTGDPEVWRGVESIPDGELWAVRENLRGSLVRFARRRVQRDLERRSMVSADFSVVGGVLDPRILTIGFARRFASYKRATLMLSDRERLLKILLHPERPLQIVVAGKSHPKDDEGKRLIQDLFNFITESGARGRMAFLEDYDMAVARAMVQGVDVWLNNPRRPNEASGTSGMKVVPNGGINCSVLDGWWDEGYSQHVGFAIGERGNTRDDVQQDWIDSRSLYALLENEISPKFYHRVDNGLPTEWIRMVKRSIMELGPRFSTGRMVRDYAERFYMPAATSYEVLRADGLAAARDALGWRDRVQKAWPQVRVVRVTDDGQATSSLGHKVRVRAEVDLGSLQPDEVRVQAVAGRVGPNRDLLRAQAHDLEHQSGDGSVHAFEGVLKLERTGHFGYTVRVLPHHEHVHVPSELSLVCWQPG